MPVAGLSAPVTLEGFLVVTASEFLAAWVVGRALNPDIDLGGSIWAGTIDMKTGHVSYSAFDAMFYAIATFHFLREWCGVTISVGGGEYSSSKVPGSYAALEKAYKAMTIAAFTGCHPSVGEGMLDTGKVFSATQVLLDRAFGRGVEQFGRTIQATEDNMALESILAVGRGYGGSHITTDQTALRFRDSLWLPTLISRFGWMGPEEEVALVERSIVEAGRLAEVARRPEGREDAIPALRKTVGRARRALLP